MNILLNGSSSKLVSHSISLCAEIDTVYGLRELVKSRRLGRPFHRDGGEGDSYTVCAQIPADFIAATEMRMPIY